jgi:hypothetical protein
LAEARFSEGRPLGDAHQRCWENAARPEAHWIPMKGEVRNPEFITR